MSRLRVAASPLALLLTLACSHAASSQSPPAATAPVGNPSLKFNDADVQFMTGMIHHHSQAVLISGWAASHGASDAIKRLTERIVVGQGDEIQWMDTWLRDRNQKVPPSDTATARMMGGMDHMSMPGMLSPEQLQQLDHARGQEFDRLFLTFMMQHHRGAIAMVDQLFATQGATQEEDSFRLASNIYADQTTEIDRMQRMLDALPSGDHHQ